MTDNMRVADYIADFISKKRVKDFFLLPGGGAMYLVDALGNYDGLNFVACHHEQTASIAAEAYSRVTENFGVALVTTGPGATNAITGVVGAWIESVPMMVISGQVKRCDMIGDRNIRQGGVQEVGIVGMISTHTKYAVTIDDPLKVKYYLEKAYHEMMSGRRGPVWIDVPLDVQAAMIDPDKLKGYDVEEVLQPIDNQKVDQLIDMVNKSQRPLILAGHGIRLSGGANIFNKLVDKLQIPVVTTWNAMDLIEHDNKFFAGKPGTVAPRAGNFTIQNCDLLISIGSRLDNIVTAYNQERFARYAQKVMVDIDNNEIGNCKIDFTLTIQSDAKLFLQELNKNIYKIKVFNREPWINKCNILKNKYAINHESSLNQKDYMSHFQFADILSRELEGGEVIATGSSGLGLEALYVAFNIKKDQRMFLTSGLGAMGYGLPAAIGACVANKRKKIVAVESDGSLQLNIQELAILKGQNLPILLFVMDNSGYASIRNTQRNYFNARYIATGEEGNLHMPDIAKICEAYGIDVSVVKTENELVDSIDDFNALIKPKVVIVKLIPNETLQPKSASIPQKDGTMVSMPLEDMSPLLSIEELKENMVHELDDLSYKVREL